MKWHYSRDEQGDVVWCSDLGVMDPSASRVRDIYTIHVTAESRNSFPCGWGVKVNGVFVQTKPSTGKLAQRSKYHAQPHDMLFRTVRDAKAWCRKNYNRTQAGALEP